MYIVFFDYDGKRYFFGITLGGAMTSCSLSYVAVSVELSTLQKEELEKEPELGTPGALFHTKGFIREELTVIDAKSGVTKTVPHAEGFISLLVDVEPPAYYAAPTGDPTFISAVDGPHGALALAQNHQAWKR
ncbi:hypothetical protein [Rhizobium sp. SG570]|uniref:hypothetical protein n=1 Tax=Rhizobium sp. SG570 TaxID=2587113 RepID=UPI00144616E2|nr:hypothetical protein [Rhizobium sp. SG570]NKJ38752.1 hypothetical protein [Rhizobium sp. SG570]